MNIITQYYKIIYGIHACTSVLIAQQHTDDKCMVITSEGYRANKNIIPSSMIRNNVEQRQFYAICIGLDSSSVSRRVAAGVWKPITVTPAPHTFNHTFSHL